MLYILLVYDAATALEALLEALSQVEPADATKLVIDPVPMEEEGIRFHRWLALDERGFPYPDTIHEADGATSPITRYTHGGYVTSDGEGRWAVFELNASGHMLVEAADMLFEHVDSEWGRYED